MHYRDGSEVKVGDRCALADGDDEELAVRRQGDGGKYFEGVILGRDMQENGCGVIIASEIEDSPVASYSAFCSGKGMLGIRCRFVTADPKHLKKV